MSYQLAAALVLLPGAVLAQDDPRTVGVSVDGVVIEAPVEVAAEACGVDAETLLAEWAQLDTEQSTMAETSVAADATDLAPGVAAGTPMDAGAEGGAGADRSEASHPADIDPPLDAAAAAAAGSTAAAPDGAASTESVVGEAASPDGVTPEEAAAGTGLGGPDGRAATGAPSLSKAAVCEISAEAAAQAGIAASD